MTRYVGPFLLLLALGAAGCGPPRVEKVTTAPVRGKVVLADGRPVTAGRVLFVPRSGNVGGVEPFGDLKKDGTFDLTTHQPGDGAPVGPYTVWLQAIDYRNNARAIEGSPIPKRYRSSSTSDLAVEVQSGENELTLTLK